MDETDLASQVSLWTLAFVLATFKYILGQIPNKTTIEWSPESIAARYLDYFPNVYHKIDFIVDPSALAHALHDYSGVLEKTYMHIVVATKQRTQTEACLKQFGSKSANIYKYYIKFNFDATFEYDFDATLFECTEFSGDITRPQFWETPLIRCICGLAFALQNTKAGKKQQFFGSSTYRMTLTDIIARTQFKNVMADLNKQPPPPIILSHDKRAGACGITPRAIVLGGNKRAISSMDEARDCTRLYSANKWCTASDYVEGGPTFDEQQTAIQQTMPNLVRTIFNALMLWYPSSTRKIAAQHGINIVVMLFVRMPQI